MQFTYIIPPNLARALAKGTVSSFISLFGKKTKNKTKTKNKPKQNKNKTRQKQNIKIAYS